MTQKIKLFMASDHAGLELKKFLIEELSNEIDFEDLGPFTTDSVAYPEYAKKLCDKVLEHNTFGLLICGSGIGMSMAANRIKKIRAALVSSFEDARLCREHNNANVLVFGARTTDRELCKNMLKIFLSTEFLGGRHQERIDMFDA